MSSTTLQTLSVESIAEITAHLSYSDLCNLQLASKRLKHLIDDEKVSDEFCFADRKVWYRFVNSEFGTVSAKPTSWKKFFLHEAVKFINDKIEFIETPSTTQVSIDKKTISGVDGHVQSFSLELIPLTPPFRYYWEIQVTRFHPQYLVAIGVSEKCGPHSNVIGCSDDYSFFYGDCFGLTFGTLHNGKTTKFGRVIREKDTVGILLDLKNLEMSVFINGEKIGTPCKNLPSQTFYPAISIQGMMQISVDRPVVSHAQLLSATSTS